MTSDYQQFLYSKTHYGEDAGFDPLFVPDYLFDFQKSLLEWSVRRGRDAVFADCGLGKTILQLVWAENVVRKTNKRVLVVTPLAVSHQTLREADKFRIEAARSTDGKPIGKITITNYERLHHFDANDYVGVVCDESSVLKNFDGVRKGIITEFLRMRPYRLLCTATAAPNDYIELGTTSEALGEMGYMDMLGRFFKNDQNTLNPVRMWKKEIMSQNKWRFKKHAEEPFWRWVSSWARALRRPSDMGFNDDRFILPPLVERQTVIDNVKLLPEELFPKIAVGLKEQRHERSLTLIERCEKAAELLTHNKPALAWCHLNQESDLLEKLIPGAVAVSGDDSDDRKEEIFLDFVSEKIRVLVTKPRIGAFGMNFQHCAHMTFFPSHSFEQYYQGVRRCWRFGQENPVIVDIVTTPGELSVLANLQRKAGAADNMFSQLVNYMNQAIRSDHRAKFNLKEQIPAWL